ncbi:receptor expression-enhancing protein 5 isoform 1 [Tropilaelaps mercedesae]|uniref:Receptor expression-enhancing protein n=1 Tax=Tropilaelaps mercedesae TaxID=418985 RepID=A0A1V9X6L4_9ACAR|nr:receptor expression-enhancing protein 5 isoform 1 [Tropilaelaps mercedesae]
MVHSSLSLPSGLGTTCLGDSFNKDRRLQPVYCIVAVLGVLALVSLYMIFGYFAAFICNFVGFVLPAYWSMSAIETSDKQDDTKWLTYWVVFAAFSVLDFFADGIFTYFPFYWLAKVIFLAWCFAPVTENGSHRIYHKMLRPYFLKKQAVIEKAFQKEQTEPVRSSAGPNSSKKD